MENLLEKIAECVEFGKINEKSPFPPQMKGQVGADELTKQALEQGIGAEQILTQGLIIGMEKIGLKFKNNEVFVPQVLMSAKAMGTAMAHLKPFFQDGTVRRKGKFVIGTVEGDLHDIGKNLVAMMVEGNGYEVIDLGVDVKYDTFEKAVEEHPDAYFAMSALLTTTMLNMEKINKQLKDKFPQIKTFVGGAPVSASFADKIGADYYTDGPQELVEILNQLTA